MTDRQSTTKNCRQTINSFPIALKHNYLRNSVPPLKVKRENLKCTGIMQANHPYDRSIIVRSEYVPKFAAHKNKLLTSESSS